MSQFWVTPNIGVRFNTLYKGEIVRGPAHNFAHVTYVPLGKVKVCKLNLLGIKNTDDTVDYFKPEDVLEISKEFTSYNKEGKFQDIVSKVQSGLAEFVFEENSSKVLDVTESEINFINIDANVWYTLECLSDKAIYHCIYAHRNLDGEVSEAYCGFEKAYR